MTMKILAVDTATSLASIAVSIDEQIVAQSLLNTARTLSARLVAEIERLLATVSLTATDIDLFAASVGPGSFTGVRGGIATVQGLALATGKPCVGFSSLAMLAMNFSLSNALICPMLDARKSEVYAALYDCSGFIPTALIENSVLPPKILLDQIAATTTAKVIFLGDGALCYQKLIAEHLGKQALLAPLSLNIPQAAHGIALAKEKYEQGTFLTEPSQLLPVYLRASDAEKMKRFA